MNVIITSHAHHAILIQGHTLAAAGSVGRGILASRLNCTYSSLSFLAFHVATRKAVTPTKKTRTYTVTAAFIMKPPSSFPSADMESMNHPASREKSQNTPTATRIMTYAILFAVVARRAVIFVGRILESSVRRVMAQRQEATAWS